RRRRRCRHSQDLAPWCSSDVAVDTPVSVNTDLRWNQWRSMTFFKYVRGRAAIRPCAISFDVADARLSCLVQMSGWKGKSHAFPILGTEHEQGIANFEAVTWFAFFLPKGAPESIVQKLRVATNATMNTPAVEEHLKEIGVDLVAGERRSPDYLRQLVVSETEKWAKVIKDAGIKPE